MKLILLLIFLPICATNLLPSKSCVCVPYWQCKDDYSGLLEEGVDVVDIRVLRTASEDLICTGDYDVCCEIQCGFRNSKFSSRILGESNVAEFAEFPWMLGLLHNKTFRCGASLIHPQVAITAAHCVSTQNQYKIRAGEWNWEEKDEPLPHQDRLTEKIIIHPEYHPRTLRNDIALLFLEKPFTLTENVGVVCIPPSGSNYDHKRCLASGWGMDSFLQGSYQIILKKIDVPVVPSGKCAKRLREVKLGPYFKLHESFICAGGEEDKDACKGDGGSPLVCANSVGHYEQIGIVSWGLTCGTANTPGVYVNVAAFRDWIDSEMTKYQFDTNIYRL